MFALWLALVVGEAGFVHHDCPMHDGRLATASAHDHSHVAATRAEQSHGSGPAGDGHHVCTCIGACSAASGGIAVDAVPALPAERVARVAVAPAPDDPALLPLRRPPFALPFANGPPSAIA